MTNDQNSATDARTAPVAVWQVLEKLRGQDLIDWRLAPVEGRASVVERNLDIGFPFGWYAIELSANLAVGEVKPLRYFSRDLAMWRGEDGQVRIIDAYCKHLGAHMGHGGHADLVHDVTGQLVQTAAHANARLGHEIHGT